MGMFFSEGVGVGGGARNCEGCLVGEGRGIDCTEAAGEARCDGRRIAGDCERLEGRCCSAFILLVLNTRLKRTVMSAGHESASCVFDCICGRGDGRLERSML